MDVADLKPNIFFGQRSGRICNNVFEALEQLLATMRTIAEVGLYL